MPQHGSGASFRTTEQHKVTQVSKEQDVSNSQSADRVFCTASSTEGEADWSIVYKDEHEEEVLQSDDEIAMKVMINEASTLLSVVTTGKEGTNRGNRLAGNGSLALLSGFVMDRQRKEGGHAWSDPRLHPERVFREQEALHLRRCTRHRGFIQNMTTGALQADTSHILVADRQPHHLDACTEQLSDILSCPHQTWTLSRPTMGALASSQRSSQTGEKACGTWRSQGSATSTRALDEVRNLLQ